MKRLLLAGLVLSTMVKISLASTPCAVKMAAGERHLASGNVAAAATSLEEAVALCARTKEGSARPLVALGTSYFRLNQCAKAIPAFTQALQLQPQLPVAQMDLGACYLTEGKFDLAIEITKRALNPKGERQTQMQANFNLGLAYVKKAAAANLLTDRSAEPYFTKSREWDPSFGGNYFYLGVLKESAEHDFKTAKALYRQGCDRHYQAACDYFAKIDQHFDGGEVAKIQQ